MTPEEAAQHTKEVIHTLGKGGGYIISPSQEVMRDISIENIIAMVKTIREERDKVFD
ncbi:hypothetical protein LJC56_00590 [Christensenellaceae bacterium OttesenSCG-928-K19]|nr:hypothetical protein [Christensenellaceae bacterium OttesenSCG-928-K19]